MAEALRLSPEQSVGAELVLRLLGLMQPALTGPDLLSPMTSEETAARLARALGERRGDQRAPESRGHPCLQAHSSDSSRPQHHREDAPPSDETLDPAATALQTLIADESANCHRELLVVLPSGARPCHAFPAARAIVLRLLDRGVRTRLIYQHAARGDLVTRSMVRELTHRGAEVRTSAELIDPLIVYDRQAVILPDSSTCGPGNRMTEAVTVDDPAMVAFTCGAFENLWNTATPFSPCTKDLPNSFDDLKMSIVQLMAMGHKDELVARRLGISVRTCRRHVAEIMDEIKATSRFQAGVNLTRAGLVDDPFPAPQSTPARANPDSSSAQADG
ncbi:LuxR C-terminal-related transcriptional regulator [Streptomyces sp. BE133]|uniref:LuxR C-terminal-related transcriptional regulator n=1 Tax=Streptomyces sp. BE133 TaxID=3002523 RepID=UPI002E759D72|nr:LuxR C-terminal-related transcriptional regulator [Streptomyces sp. BE133]MEE1806305.1 LuxR C-terminal-related transcriptional regulator [Streptomyces sp. BE133]